MAKEGRVRLRGLLSTLGSQGLLATGSSQEKAWGLTLSLRWGWGTRAGLGPPVLWPPSHHRGPPCPWWAKVLGPPPGWRSTGTSTRHRDRRIRKKNSKGKTQNQDKTTGRPPLVSGQLIQSVSELMQPNLFPPPVFANPFLTSNTECYNTKVTTRTCTTYFYGS